MIMINDQWELVRDIDDVCRILEENIGAEFSQKVRNMFYQEDVVTELECQIADLETENNLLENQLDDSYSDYENLEEVVEKLKDALEDAAYEVVQYEYPNCYDFSEYKREYISELVNTYKIPAEYVPN